MNLEQTSEMPHPCNELINQTERNIALLVYGGSSVVSIVTSLVAVVLIVVMKLYVQFMYRLALYQEFSSIFISLTQCGHRLCYFNEFTCFARPSRSESQQEGNAMVDRISIQKLAVYQQSNVILSVLV